MAKQRLQLMTATFIAITLSACGGGGDPNNTAPIAKAGDDQNVNDGATVALDGSASSDADGDTLTFSWEQTGGTAVTLGDSAGEATLTFDAPVTFDPAAGDGGRTLTFVLTVSDGQASATDGVAVIVQDVTPPAITVSPEGGTLEKTEKVIVTFTEPVNQESLVLTGSLADEAELAWHEDSPVLELSPTTATGGWTTGADRTLLISIADAAGNSASLGVTYLVNPGFATFQPADVVIGQPDMLSNTDGAGVAGIDTPYGRAWIHEGRLYLPDYNNNRVLGFSNMPMANGTRADFVIGQGNFATTTPGASQTEIDGPQGVSIQGNALVVTEYNNNRISIYTPLPTATENAMPGTLSAVVGQAGFDTLEGGCTASRFNIPEDSIVTPDGKLIVTDANNSRVLVWNTLPTDPADNRAPADLVLGQLAFDQCRSNDSNHNGENDPEDGPATNTMSYPAGVWSDGEKLVVLDSDNNRALIWNTFPTDNGQAADLVLGQPGFDTNASNNNDADNEPEGPAANTLNRPYNGLASNGAQLFIADSNNNRVLIWNTWPTKNHQPADIVLGQASFDLSSVNNDDADDSTQHTGPTARTLSFPVGLFVHGSQLIVTDNGNSRYLIFNAQ